MWTAELEERWRELAEDVIVGMKEWRLQHPRASLREIEAALDARWATVRARMVQDAALTSAVADLTTASPAERPRCTDCGQLLEAHGQDRRELTTHADKTITLWRSYAACPHGHGGFFPPR